MGLLGCELTRKQAGMVKIVGGKSFINLRGEKTERKWSGLSESNRHLNLGKVPYYHYTKAASDYNFYSTLPPATTRHSRNS